MRSIDKIINDINVCQQHAATQLDAIHPSVRPGFEMAAREARENLVRLRQEYEQRIFSQAVAFFLAGDKEKVARFVELAHKLGNVFIANGSAVYEQLADRVEPTLGASREFSVNQLHEVILGIREIAVNAGLRGELPAPRLHNLRAVQTRDELVFYIHELVASAMGESLNTIFVSQKLIDEALARRFDGQVLAAVVVNTTPVVAAALAQPFSTKTDVTIGTEDEVDEAFVLRVFKMGKKNRQERR